MKRNAFKIYLDNMDHDDGFVTVHTFDIEEAVYEFSIMDTMWEAPSDMDIAYAIIMDKPGLVEELKADGYEVDDSNYYEMDESEWEEIRKKYSSRKWAQRDWDARKLAEVLQDNFASWVVKEELLEDWGIVLDHLSDKYSRSELEAIPEHIWVKAWDIFDRALMPEAPRNRSY